MECPDELKRAFSQRDLIVCVGPEPSVSAGLPSLRRLAHGLLEQLETEASAIDADELRARADAGKVAEVLQLVQRQLGDGFTREVQMRLDDASLEPPPLLRELARLRPRLRAAYSVCLDRLLERAFEGRWPVFADARPDLVQRRNLIFKILGTLPTPSSWVLTHAKVQQELNPGAARHDVFAASYRAHQMLFVGFRADDPELALLLDMTPAAPEGHGPGHFIALPKCSATDRELLEGGGLQVITSDGQAVLEELAASLGGETLIEPLAVPAAAVPRRRLGWIAAGVLLTVVGVVGAIALGADSNAPDVDPALRTTVGAAVSRRDAGVAERVASDSTGSGSSVSVSGSTGPVSASSDSTDADSTNGGASTGSSSTGSTVAPDPPRPRPRPRRCYFAAGNVFLGKQPPQDKRCDRYRNTARSRPGCDQYYLCR